MALGKGCRKEKRFARFFRVPKLRKILQAFLDVMDRRSETLQRKMAVFVH